MVSGVLKSMIVVGLLSGAINGSEAYARHNKEVLFQTVKGPSNNVSTEENFSSECLVEQDLQAFFEGIQGGKKSSLVMEKSGQIVMRMRDGSAYVPVPGLQIMINDQSYDYDAAPITLDAGDKFSLLFTQSAKKVEFLGSHIGSLLDVKRNIDMPESLYEHLSSIKKPGTYEFVAPKGAHLFLKDMYNIKVFVDGIEVEVNGAPVVYSEGDMITLVCGFGFFSDVVLNELGVASQTLVLGDKKSGDIAQELQVYTDGSSIQLHGNNLPIGTQAQLYSISGSLVKSRELGDKQNVLDGLDVFQSGIYILRFFLPDGTIIIKRIMY